jgi:hypothetical protein
MAKASNSFCFKIFQKGPKNALRLIDNMTDLLKRLKGEKHGARLHSLSHKIELMMFGQKELGYSPIANPTGKLERRGLI